MSKLPFVHLKAKRNSVHPWIFLKMVARPQKKMQQGEMIEVYSRENEFIGRGFYNRKSNINIRLLTENIENELNEEFFFKKIAAAVDLRKNLLKLDKNSDSYRIINSEGDYLSGIIIDKYNNVIVIEPLSAGYFHIIEWIIKSLKKLYPECQITVRSDPKNSEREGVFFDKLDARYPGPKNITIHENNLKMNVNLETGHKTGYFLDQRENRAFLASLVKGKTVLDLCCYTGGFAISAALAGASTVTAIDLDEKAIAVAEQNSALNNVKINFVHANTYDFLRTEIEAGRKHDVIILDPPKLGRNKEELGKAKKSYNDLNRMAMQCINDNGILLTCSCTGNLTEQDFLAILTRAANEADVVLQIFKIAGPSDDHPTLHSYPEGRYLKAVYAKVTHAKRTYHPVPKFVREGEIIPDDEPEDLDNETEDFEDIN
jgi:23S rRNA (cytosine1962-C5)-methyltransferase